MSLKSLLAAYAAQSGRYDELLGEARHPRAHWDAFLHALASRGALAEGRAERRAAGGAVESMFPPERARRRRAW